MIINEFVEMTIFLCLICFSIYDKMQGFIYESGLFNFLFIYFFFFFAFYAEMKKDGDFCKSPVDSADTLWVKSFVKIALSCSVSEINMFLHFTQKFKIPARLWKNHF